MAPQRKNAAQDTTIAPASPKEKGKAIEVAKPASRHPNLFDVHITNAKILSLLQPRHRGSI